MLPDGTTLFSSRYEVLRCIGVGGVGAVYEVLDRKTERHRALKVLQAGQLANEEQRERFLREATIAARIRSEHLVEVFDAGVDAASEVPFLVMELLRGQDLAAHISEHGALPAVETVALLAQAAMALDRLHMNDIVHRDIKPENLFVSTHDDGSPCLKILDLGIAKVIAPSQNLSHTNTGGTPLYMSPEQIRSDANIDRRADLYALGMTGYTMLVGRCYWFEDADKGIFSLTNKLEAGPVEPAGVRAKRLGVSLPSGVDTWFAKATRRDREHRFDSASELVVELAEALDVEVPHALRSRLSLLEGKTLPAPGLSSRPVVTLDACTRKSSPPSDAHLVTPADADLVKPSWRRVKWWLWLSAAAVALAAAGGWETFTRVRGVAAPDDSASVVSAPNALLAPDSVLACPVLEVSGVTEPGGWFGAAASTLACDRATWLLGGRWDRTLFPAELLGLPHEATPDFPTDPYADVEARSRSLSVARERANAWLDGAVARERGGYAIKLRILTRDKELGSAEGRAPILFDAVAQALDGLVASGALPRSRELDPRVARFVGTSAVKAGLIASTWQTRSDPEDPISSSCIQLHDDLPGAGLLGRTIGIVCARRLGWERPESVELDRSSPFALAYTAVMKLLLEEGWDPAPVAQALEAARREEADPQARAWLADSEIALWEIAKRPDRAVRVARELIEEFPRVASFRHASAVYAESSSLRTAGLKAHAAWLPYDARSVWSTAWMLDEDLPLQLSWSRRAFELDSANATYAVELAENLFMADRASEVPSIAARFEGVERHADLVDYLGAHVEAEAGRPSAGLDRLLRRLRETPSVGRTTDHHLMLTALHLAEMLGRGREFADFFVNRFVLADPPRLVAPPPLRNQAGLIGLCMRASDPIARPCLERVRSHFKMRWSPDDEQYWQGAMRYVAGDCSGAVDRWRPLLTRSASHLTDAPVEAFDRAGEPELASRLDAVGIKQRRYAIRGVNLAWVREARRAAKRGDLATARKLANQVVGAWEVLDTRLPVVDEMRTLGGR